MKKQATIVNLAKVELKKLLDKTKLGDFGRLTNLENKVCNLNFRINRIERKVGLAK